MIKYKNIVKITQPIKFIFSISSRWIPQTSFRLTTCQYPLIIGDLNNHSIQSAYEYLIADHGCLATQTSQRTSSVDLLIMLSRILSPAHHQAKWKHPIIFHYLFRYEGRTSLGCSHKHAQQNQEPKSGLATDALQPPKRNADCEKVKKAERHNTLCKNVFKEMTIT